MGKGIYERDGRDDRRDGARLHFFYTAWIARLCFFSALTSYPILVTMEWLSVASLWREGWVLGVGISACWLRLAVLLGKVRWAGVEIGVVWSKTRLVLT